MIAATARTSRRRSGITLTEILIAILIMGVGLISLATLFPLGLIRLREGTRQGRAGLMFQTAADDMDSRGLLFKQSFEATWYGLRDPFTQDVLADNTYNQSNTYGSGVIAAGSTYLSANNIDSGNSTLPNGATNPHADGIGNLNPLTTGLPICYDPLWRSITGVAPVPQQPLPSNTTLAQDTTLDIQQAYLSPTTPFNEARFGAGVFGTNQVYPYLHDDPTPGQGGTVPSACGLQRLTNFIPWSSAGLTPQFAFTCNNFALSNQPADVAGSIFASGDDIVFNPPGGEVKVVVNGNVVSASSVLPDLSNNNVLESDYRFTWFFTGRQVDTTNGAQFVGEIVVCDGRPFGFDPLPGTNAYAPAGETVVEAVYGYGGNSRAVLLRWNAALADPPLRAGGWICDTTYERSVTTYRSRVRNTGTPFARCYWYQIAKRVDPTPDPNPNYSGYRSAVVTLNSPVRVVTAQGANPTYTPVHSNVALIMPSVVNVFPRTFEVR